MIREPMGLGISKRLTNLKVKILNAGISPGKILKNIKWIKYHRNFREDNKIKMNRSRAFSLIEIIVVISIIIIFSGFILAAYNNFTQSKILEQEANHLIDILSLAKGKTQAGDVEFEGCLDADGNEFGGYRVEVSEFDYGLQQCCRDINTKNVSICGSYLNIHTLPGFISNLSGSINVDFQPLSGGVNPTELILKNSNIKKCVKISIYSTGIISPGTLYSC